MVLITLAQASWLPTALTTPVPPASLPMVPITLAQANSPPTVLTTPVPPASPPMALITSVPLA
ncbi:hypothetical protein D3C87_2034780 [compost metagenome]